MHTIYLWCLLVGLILLCISLIGTGITDLFQVDFPIDLNVAPHSDILSGLIPLSSLEICAFIIGFGGMGLILLDKVSYHLPLATGTGVIFCLSTKKLLNYLKKVESHALTDEQLIGMKGMVAVTIFENGIGSVSLDTPQGKITYSAKSTKGFLLQGTPVEILAIENHTLIVSDISLYSNKL